jgi:hypothetical protein
VCFLSSPLALTPTSFVPKMFADSLRSYKGGNDGREERVE